MKTTMNTRRAMYELMDKLDGMPLDAPGRKVLEAQLLQMQAEIARADAGDAATVRESDTAAKIYLSQELRKQMGK